MLLFTCLNFRDAFLEISNFPFVKEVKTLNTTAMTVAGIDEESENSGLFELNDIELELLKDQVERMGGDLFKDKNIDGVAQG